jgi:ATP-dependent metalloprotease
MDYQNKSVFKSILAKLGNIVSYGLLVALLFATFFIYKTLFPSDISTPDIGAKPGSIANQKPKFGSLFGSHTFQEVKPEEISAKFKDVKGVPEAKLELQEVVDYLKDTEKYTRLGGRLPKGVLLVGPPGTGKTLLAKAVAGEASVPFFHCSGSEFDEMFVGTGARKMRQLFQAARARAPCVIFIDEIDSVGAKRTNSMAHPYANQTINQMLAEMDGFLVNEGIIVLGILTNLLFCFWLIYIHRIQFKKKYSPLPPKKGATNRRNQLDPALLRPGRFDLEVNVGVPDVRGRAEILEHYLKKVVLSADADVEILSRLTVGFTGADLENLVNQAALRAALENDVEVRMKHLQWSFDRIKMGAAKLSRIPDEKTNRCTAYHEAGHTIVSFYTKESMKPHKVTIIQRGQALGVTAFAPEEKNLYGTTKAQLIAFIDVAMGGRAAEEISMITFFFLFEGQNVK